LRESFGAAISLPCMPNSPLTAYSDTMGIVRKMQKAG
jgi:hypothetical protein